MVIKKPIRAGDTLKIEFTADHDSGTFTPYLALSNATNHYTATGSGDFEITVPFATTATWAAGSYTYSVYVSDGTEKHTIESGTVEVLPDLSAGAVDARTTNRQILDAIESTIQGHATTGQQSTSINGKSIARYTPDELLKLHKHFKRLVKEDEAKARFGSTTRKIYLRG